MLTEQQRLEAIATCERIEELNTKIQEHARKAIEIIERMAKQPASFPAKATGA